VHGNLLARIALLPAFVLLALAPTAAETLQGRVVGITDGDTVKLLVGGHSQYKIRLGEIDAPETGQPFGKASKRVLSDMAFGATVSVRVTDIDRYGRSVGVITRDGKNINAAMVRAGAAWAYRSYLSDKRYLVWEAEAKHSRRGLWGLQPDQIMPPWEWRAALRGKGRGKSSISALPTSNRADHVLATPAAVAQVCGVKLKCSQMTSCAEARYQMQVCRVATLDGNGDGVPCNKLCR
jgi:endonuclease YncB( thermonuclease family)